MALWLNSMFTSSNEKYFRSFGADDVHVIHLEIEQHSILKYWGKINWLSIPSDYICYRQSQDPFYGVFKYENGQLEFMQGAFGDDDKNDLDANYWVKYGVNWKYNLI